MSKQQYCHNKKMKKILRAIMVMIAWYLDLQLPMQSVPITTDVVGSNLDQGEEYNIM
jgi:hypothetical protein